MIRVGFILDLSQNNWMGGVNYFKNLFIAILAIPDRKIDPVLIISTNSELSEINNFPNIEIIRTELINQKNFSWKILKITQRIFGRDYLMERFLLKNKIEIISHSGHLGRNSRVPTIGWIPDFQHVRMPEFFEKSELKIRNARFNRICDWCTSIVLSSQDSKNDLAKFSRQAAKKGKILQFTAGISNPEEILSIEDLRKIYNFSGEYFHLPNQFWAHKNHKIIVDALVEIKLRGYNLIVLATGNTKDSRNSNFFNDFVEYINKMNVGDCFKILGLVPFNHLSSLMYHSMAVINPSKFEGWSTSVEEAKSSGNSIILSDIAVHKEQAPKRGIYFHENDKIGAADAMLKIYKNFNKSVEIIEKSDSKLKLKCRIINYGGNFEKIVLETLNEFHKKNNNL